MTMKKILMAAVAVSALSAGVANAAIISNASTIGTVSIASGAAGYDPYTIANELVTSATSNIAASLTFTPTASAIAPGTYIVTWTVSGGTFDVASPYTYTGTAAGVGTNTGSASTKTATTITASYTVAGDSAASFTLGGPILIGTAKSNVIVSGSITKADGTAIDGGAIAPVTVVDYRTGLKFVATKANPVLTISDGFLTFASAATSATVGTGVGVALNDKPVAAVTAADLIHWNLTGAAVTAASLVSGVKLTVGGTLSKFDLFAGNDASSTTKQVADASTTNVITADATTLAGLVATTPIATIGLKQKTVPVAGTESAYTVTPVVTLSSLTLYTPLVLAEKALGSVTYDGTSFYAPWVGDGVNGITYTIRIANPSGTVAIPSVKAAIANATNASSVGTVTQAATCDLGTLPAAGEILISTAKLNACFGNFGRADLTVIVNGTMTGGTAKMRVKSVNDTVSDVPMGRGLVAAAAQ